MSADAAELRAWIEGAASLLFLGLFLYLLIELLFVHFRRHTLRLRETRMAALGVLSQGLATGAVLWLWGPLSVFVAASAGAALSPFEARLGWPWWIFGFVVYEFFYWLQHWAGHKVRLLWCIHSPHHAPGGIHMLIGANHSLFETTSTFRSSSGSCRRSSACTRSSRWR